MIRFPALLLLALTASAQAQDASTPPARTATEQDLKLLNSPKYRVAGEELARIGLHQTVGKACRVFITADSVRPIQTPFTINGINLTLPFSSFLIWSSDRPIDDAVLYHLFGRTAALYAKPQTLPAGETRNGQAVQVALAPRQSYPSLDEVQRDRAKLLRGAAIKTGETKSLLSLTVQPYLLPTAKDQPSSDFPNKDRKTLAVTCLSDPKRVTDCLCAGTE